MWIKTIINTQDDVNDQKIKNLSDMIFSFCDARYKLNIHKLFNPFISGKPTNQIRIETIPLVTNLFRFTMEIDSLNQFRYGKDLENFIMKIKGRSKKIHDQFIHGMDALYFSFTGGVLTNDDLFKSFRNETLEIVQKRTNPTWFPKISRFIQDETVAHHLIQSDIGLKNVDSFERFIYHDALMIMILRIDPELIFEL